MTDYTVAAVDEAIALLLFVAQNPGLGVTELAERSGNTKARTFRLLYTLEQRGMVHKDGESPTYSLGYKSLYVGVAAQEQVSLVRIAASELRDIGAKCNENVQLRVRDGLETVCVARWESTQAVRVHGNVGNRRPLHAGASGKVLLAFAPEEVRQAVLTSNLVRFTPETITQRSKLTQEIAKIVKLGYSVSISEMSDGAVAVAAPVFDVTGNIVASLSIAGPSSRLTADNLPAFVQLVQDHALRLSASMGFSRDAKLIA
ncbi:IclR family transcriptional regulator [Undibacterium sp.]|jgi:IclR family KDG regulon transcriptional repressor|uniref:IclR family transcriptional regulator n=1 Tax=Undibacterium sp. TaxID=1914977 RepID=UPI002BEA9944|nr:IclR family transcriptional regulator [Undibacterium sp.]HTD02390.1 IclR family transcriptional regulator [Undibacterium sp.]